MKKSIPGFQEFFVKFQAYAQHKRLMKAPKKRERQVVDEIELPEVPPEEEVEKVGKEVKEENEE